MYGIKFRDEPLSGTNPPPHPKSPKDSISLALHHADSLHRLLLSSPLSSPSKVMLMLMLSLIRPMICLSMFCLSLVAMSATADEKTCESKKCCDSKSGCESKQACELTKDCESKKGCCPGKSACSSESCPVETAMAKLPKMTYLVGTEATCCSESAETLAKAADQPIQFVVGDETFDSKAAAMTVLVSTTEAMVAEFTSASKCEVSGTTTIAGRTCKCPVEAGQTVEKVNSAVTLVVMNYKVGEETCSCPCAAKTLAKKAGVSPVFVVDGVETSCELTARLALARAKYKAAVQAIATTTPATEQPVESTQKS